MDHNRATPVLPAHGAFTASMADALQALGAHPGTLAGEELRALDEHGFVILKEMMPTATLAAFREVHERLMRLKYPDAQLPSAPAKSVDALHHEDGARRLADLVSEDALYDRTYSDPRLLAAMAHIFGRDFKLYSINARDALPGRGAQPFHRDAVHPEGVCVSANSAWLLDDFTVENGATRVIPGSHRHRDLPADGAAAHPDEVLITAPAGSVVVFRGDLLHSGTRNRTTAIRRAFHVFFSERQTDLGRYAQRLRIRKATWERICPAARWILDV